jgi:hypothetical protein
MTNDSVTEFIAELGARPATITARISHHSGCYGDIDPLKNLGIPPFAAAPSLFSAHYQQNSKPLRPETLEVCRLSFEASLSEAPQDAV